MDDLKQWQKQILELTKYNKNNLIKAMKTSNSISGGKSSAYIAANYKADFNLFALVTTNDKTCLFPDSKVRQIVSDRIGKEFVGTLEMDDIIYTILDLEQFIGRKIDWVSGMTFEDMVRKRKTLPSVFQRFCTSELKIEPMKKFWYDNINEPMEVRIGFRANEMRRAKTMIEKCNDDGFMYSKFKVGKSDSGRNKLKELKWQKPFFPLIEDGIFKDNIEEFWKDKQVRFAYKNNCVGCFERNPIMLNYMSKKESNKFDFFMNLEKEMQAYFVKTKGKESKYGRFLDSDITYEKIKNHKLQMDLFDDDFNTCDSGYCGL